MWPCQTITTTSYHLDRRTFNIKAIFVVAFFFCHAGKKTFSLCFNTRDWNGLCYTLPPFPHNNKQGRYLKSSRFVKMYCTICCFRSKRCLSETQKTVHTFISCYCSLLRSYQCCRCPFKLICSSF